MSRSTQDRSPWRRCSRPISVGYGVSRPNEPSINIDLPFGRTDRRNNDDNSPDAHRLDRATKVHTLGGRDADPDPLLTLNRRYLTVTSSETSKR